jgi:hypothetical protein
MLYEYIKERSVVHLEKGGQERGMRGQNEYDRSVKTGTGCYSSGVNQ